METAGKKRKRKWWHRLITLVATIVHPALGLVVGLAISALTEKTTIITGGLDPTEAQVNQAINIIENYIIPVLNNITASITALKETVSQIDIINSLNDSLEKIAVLQAYVRHSKSSMLIPVNYMVGATIEALLAKMNSLVTEAINRTKLQKNVELQTITIKASNYSKVGIFKLVWFNQTVSQAYQKLVYVKSSTTQTVITPSIDNPALSTVVETVTEETTENPLIKTGQQQPTKPKEKKGISKIWLAIGLFVGYKVLTNKSKPTGLNGSCTNRVKCKGINKRTGHTNKGHKFIKGGAVVKTNKRKKRRKTRKPKGLKGVAKPLEVTI